MNSCQQYLNLPLERHSLGSLEYVKRKNILVPFQKQDTDREGEWLSWSEGGRGEQLFLSPVFSHPPLAFPSFPPPFRHSARARQVQEKSTTAKSARGGKRRNERESEHERICFHHAKQHHNMPRPSRRPLRPLCYAPPFPPPPCLSCQGTHWKEIHLQEDLEHLPERARVCM